MDSVKALDSFQQIIQENPSISDFCEREAKWIQNRKLDWGSDRIRVGVIGVTSSGKSTLINAILGTEILSSAIAPSSGQLVCCSYGTENKIIIHFENGTSQTLCGKNFTRTILEQYSDERFNPQNTKGVLSIELTSPLFDFGKDVLLVDSPGLDAFGLEAHERLTLESLVPTIDACIYVTTMKTNSDRKTLEILNTVAKYNCPIIIVQNMLDAVRPSPSGDKTSEQVARDHKNRVQRIVDNSLIEDKSSVQIIQISAEYAKRWRAAQTSGITPPITQAAYEKSNYESFVRSVSEVLEVQRPRIERQRLLSIKTCASDLTQFIQGKINKPVGAVEETFPLEALKEKIERHGKKLQSAYQKILKDYEVSVHNIRVAIGVEKGGQEENKKIFAFGFTASILNLFSNSGSNLEDSLKTTNETVSAFESALANIISEHNAFVNEVAKFINIPSRDLLCSSALHSFRAVSLEKKTAHRTRKVKKSGFGGGAARFFGKIFRQDDWGYEYESYDEVVTDTEKTKKKICDRLEDAYNRYTSSMSDWEEKIFNRSMALIIGEIESAEESYRKKKEAYIEVESLSNLSISLLRFIELMKKSLPEAKFKDYKENKEYDFTTKQIDVELYSYALLELSRKSIQQQHREIMKSFVGAIGCNNSKPILISWDENSKDEFLWQTGISDATVVEFPTNGTILPQGKKRCLFILVNAIQYGAALKQISDLKLNSVLTKEDYVVWVVQDFQELLTGDRAAEGLIQMAELHGITRIPCNSTIFIMHENPAYNYAFLKYQFDPSLQKALHKLIDELQTKFGVYLTPEVSDTIGEIFRKVHLR